MQNVLTVPGITINNQNTEEMALRKAELMYMSWYIKLLDMKEKDLKN